MNNLLRLGLLFTAMPLLAASHAVREVGIVPLSEWKEVSFKGNTAYQTIEDQQGPAIKAVSKGAASALAKRITINLDETPYLHWRWRVEGVLENPDERSKAGDDYPARIYVVKEGGWAPWRTRSMNYVWSSSQAKGSAWPSAYTGQSMMLAVGSGDAAAQQWKSERRNVKQDFKRYFGEDIREIDVVAIMTDTDNTGATATAWYGDIYFASE